VIGSSISSNFDPVAESGFFAPGWGVRASPAVCFSWSRLSLVEFRSAFRIAGIIGDRVPAFLPQSTSQNFDQPNDANSMI
jgi:hypothetical protein